MRTAKTILTALVAASLGLLGCMKPNPLIDALAEGTGESGEDSELDPSDGDTAEGDTALPDLGGDEPLSCAPFDEFDAQCGACLGASCCDLMLECAAVEDCTCLADCLLAGGNNGSCKNSCGGTQPSAVAELEILLACADDVCSSAC